MSGIRVITLDAYKLGEVDGVHADTNDWKITDLEVKLTKEAAKEIGIKYPKFGSLTVCLPIFYIRQFGDVVVLKHDLKQFKNLNECKPIKK